MTGASGSMSACAETITVEDTSGEISSGFVRLAEWLELHIPGV